MNQNLTYELTIDTNGRFSMINKPLEYFKKLIETKTRTYTVEYDIIRFEDIYGRKDFH